MSYLATTFSWRAIFLINLPLGILAQGLAAVVLQSREADSGQHKVVERGFDVAGFALASVGFTVLVYGLTEAGINGWGQPVVARALLLSGIVLLLLVGVEWRVSSPVLEVRIFRYVTFTRAVLLIWVVTGFYYGSLFLIPFFFEKVQGHSALTAGELMISQGVAAAVGIAVGGELYNKVGPRPLAIAGMASLAVSGIGFTHLTVGQTGLSLQVWLVLRGLGLGLATTPLQNLALSVVDRRDLARATSLVNVTRQVASAAGVAALAAYVAQRAVHHASVAQAMLRTAPPWSGIAETCRARLPVVAPCIQRHAVTGGLNDAFLLGLIVCSGGVVLALFVGRDPGLEALKGQVTTRIAQTFPQLSREELVEAASRAEAQTFQGGRLIVRQGDQADHFYIVCTGEVRVTRQTTTGVVAELATLGPGQYFGEIGLLANLPRTATVTAMTPVELLVLNEATFADLVERSRAMARDVRRVMEERLAVLP